jgi:mannosyltransferase OCH1-like enzyme
MQTWRDKMPDYELILWDKNKFDVDSEAFVREACAAEKFAFASDYIRAHALYAEGGIYLDTDVIVKKSFSEFLEAGFFTAVQYSPDIVARCRQDIAELLTADGCLKNNLDATIVCVPGICLQPEIMGGVAGHPYLKDVLSWYENRPFNRHGLVYGAPDVYTTIATKHGFHYKNELQFFGTNMVVYPSPVFVGNLKYVTKES